jgi:hypothetical protein
MDSTYNQKYYRKNKIKRKKESLIYSKNNNYKSQKKYCKEYNNKLKQAVFNILGKECSFCGFNDIRALQIDHVNGGGLKEIRLSKGNYYKFLLTEIISNPNKYQVLCANCNWIKRSVNNENRR